ncbi:MAG: ERV1/ALR-related protein [Bacillati bacterium]
MPDALELIKWYNERNGRGNEMRKKVGNAFWTYQHKLAEWTPPEPEAQTRAFQNLVAGIATFPCKECSSHGLEYIKSHPFNPNEETIDKYLCQFHNMVNDHLGKPSYNCTGVISTEQSEVKAIDPCVEKEVLSRFLDGVKDEEIRAKLMSIKVCD